MIDVFPPMWAWRPSVLWSEPALPWLIPDEVLIFSNFPVHLVVEGEVKGFCEQVWKYYFQQEYTVGVMFSTMRFLARGCSSTY